MATNNLVPLTGITGRPFGVSVIAVVVMVFGIITAVLGLLEMLTGFVSGIFGSPRVAGREFLGGIASVVLGAAYVIAGAGLWNLRRWAWWLGVLAGIVGFVLAFGSPFGMLIWAALVAYLFFVRANFGVLPRVPQLTHA